MVALMDEEKVRELSQSLADASGEVHEVFIENESNVKFTFKPSMQNAAGMEYGGDHEGEKISSKIHR